MKTHKTCDDCGRGYKPPGRPMKYNQCRTCRERARIKRLAVTKLITVLSTEE